VNGCKNRRVDLDLVFLGTAGSAPTAQRAPTALMIRRGGERLLFDCAEGTQRQLMRSQVGLVALREVFLTHFHADHYLGLPGMLKTFSLHGREEPLTVYGPAGLRDLMSTMARMIGRLSYEVTAVELEAGETLPRDEYELRPFAVSHAVSALGYALVEAERPGRFDADAADRMGIPHGPERGALQRGDPVTLADGRVVSPSELIGAARPGRTVVVAGDTAPAGSVIEAAQGADVLVHEATFTEEESERAAETSHSTATGAATVARAAGVGLLALTHLSSRYFGRDVRREAETIFPNTVVPRDFDTIEVPFEERGAPRLVKGGALRERGAEAPTDAVSSTP
jgi:ribonuclease Z